MCAAWLKLVVLCVGCTARSAAENRGVIWRDLGEDVTIQCSGSVDQQFFSLTMGLNEDTNVFFMEKNSGKTTIANGYAGRLQSNGGFYKMDILIKNLTLNDTGPYWCVYKMFDPKSSKSKSTKGQGSVLLVVTGDRHADTDPVQGCDGSHQDLVLVSVVISAAVLLCVLMAFLILIILKTRSLRASGTPRRLPTNDVYEDMRGTFRR
ncbi:uncharacterized protein LOC103361856 [Stegastes partitus]|uniref:Uncharacterized protein LOC103361856 n=1 Tax=Stegastes partitus TaxID=144197 RepID=A0A9Y4KC39_9TELE|nr:PREDICTED: uncharacterized protein LOC103361856 [Stegastes partitus]